MKYVVSFVATTTTDYLIEAASEGDARAKAAKDYYTETTALRYEADSYLDENIEYDSYVEPYEEEAEEN